MSINLENSVRKVNEFKGPLSKSIVVYTAKRALNQYNRRWVQPKTSELAEAIASLGLLELIETPLLDRKLDKELTAQGIAWLNRFLFKKNGEPRRTSETRGLHPDVFNIVKKFSHFTFAGFQDGNGYGELVPTWRVHAKNGSSFRYTYTSGAYSFGGGGLNVWDVQS